MGGVGIKKIVITHAGREYVSTPFNFKAFRRMYRMLEQKEKITQVEADAAGLEGLIALFELTPLTMEILNEVDAQQVMTASETVFSWFQAVEIKKSSKQLVGTPPEDPILAIYHGFLRSHLPSELDKQDPQLLFDIFATDTGDAIDANEIPNGYQEMYGL